MWTSLKTPFVIAIFMSALACTDKGSMRQSIDHSAASPKNQSQTNASQTKAQNKPDTTGLDAGEKYLLEKGLLSLENVQKALDSGQAVQLVDCAMVRGAMHKLSTSKNREAVKLVAEGRKACEVDAPMASIKAWKAEVETEAKKAKPVNAKCFDRRRKDLDALQKTHPADPTVKAVAAFIKTTCRKKP